MLLEGLGWGHRESWPQQPALSQLWRLRDRITTSNARADSRGDDPFMSSFRRGSAATLCPLPRTRPLGATWARARAWAITSSSGRCHVARRFSFTLAPFYGHALAPSRRTLKSHQFRGTWRRLTCRFHQFRFASLHAEN